jgi:hypothetical protein
MSVLEQSKTHSDVPRMSFGGNTTPAGGLLISSSPRGAGLSPFVAVGAIIHAEIGLIDDIRCDCRG